jgi:hypothetical protein
MALGAPCGVPQAWLPMRVTSSWEARRLVRARGGTLYVTLENGGARMSTVAPAEVVDTDGVDGGGYLLVYDRRLAMPEELRVSASADALALEASGPGDAARVVWWRA